VPKVATEVTSSSSTFLVIKSISSFLKLTILAINFVLIASKI
jgi:hypothetical protein